MDAIPFIYDKAVAEGTDLALTLVIRALLLRVTSDKAHSLLEGEIRETGAQLMTMVDAESISLSKALQENLQGKDKDMLDNIFSESRKTMFQAFDKKITSLFADADGTPGKI